MFLTPLKTTASNFFCGGQKRVFFTSSDLVGAAEEWLQVSDALARQVLEDIDRSREEAEKQDRMSDGGGGSPTVMTPEEIESSALELPKWSETTLEAVEEALRGCDSFESVGPGVPADEAHDARGGGPAYRSPVTGQIFAVPLPIPGV